MFYFNWLTALAVEVFPLLIQNHALLQGVFVSSKAIRRRVGIMPLLFEGYVLTFYSSIFCLRIHRLFSYLCPLFFLLTHISIFPIIYFPEIREKVIVSLNGMINLCIELTMTCADDFA